MTNSPRPYARYTSHNGAIVRVEFRAISGLPALFFNKILLEEDKGRRFELRGQAEKRELQNYLHP
jgi:hypothetical protein